jgi:pyruvate/2-oxoglutarate dehydrogenase complex dihydrolipoamide acyltransferase (E2) component
VGVGVTTLDIVMPQLGETVTEGTVTAWHKKVGERVRRDETLFEVSTDKVDTEVPAPADGVIAEILVPEGATVAVGTVLAVIAGEGVTPLPVPPPHWGREPTAKALIANSPTTPSKDRKGGAATPPPPLRGRVGERGPDSRRNRDSQDRPLSPAVRRLANDHGIDPGGLAGSGADGRVTRRDMEAALKSRPVAGGDDERIPFSRIRKLTAERMVRSKAVSPHVLQAVEADFHRVERARAAHGERWKAREGYGLSYLPFIAFAVCRAIADFPRINASVEGETLVVHKSVHLGIAVDLALEGLTVPVIRDAHTRDVAALARDIRRVAEGARAGTLGPDDYAGGTYTLSNSGSFGTLITAPVINQPQVAILSTDGVKKRPVVIEGPDGDSIAIRPVGILAQSFDHRAIDGAYSAAFLHRVAEIVATRDWIADLS